MNKTLRLTLSIYLVSFLPLSIIGIILYIINGAQISSILLKLLIFTLIMFVLLYLYMNSFIKLNGYAYNDNAFINMSSGTKYEEKNIVLIKNKTFIFYIYSSIYFNDNKKIKISFNNKVERENFLRDNNLNSKLK